MEKKYLVAASVLIAALLLAACAPAATPTPTPGIGVGTPAPTVPLGTPGAEETPGLETPTPEGGVTETPTSLRVESPTP